MFGGLLQPGHLVLILIIVLVLVGPGKLPDVAKGVGKSIREFKKATQDVTQEVTGPINDVKQPFREMKQQVESIRQLPADTFGGVSHNGAAPSNGAMTHGTAAAPISVATRKCAACSSANPAGNAFCSQCGARLV